jgi:prephenate dehydrogenase (NADP+)
MLGGEARKLAERVYWGRERVFGWAGEDREGDGGGAGGEGRTPIFLSEDILDRFSLGRPSPSSPTTTRPEDPNPDPKANSHLSLLAMVDCWAHLNIQPQHHLTLAATPIFRLWLGVAEYLFRSRTRLDAAVSAALTDTSHRSDDLEFVVAARGWSQCVRFGSFELYKERFGETAVFFRSRFEEAGRVGSAMIQAIMEEQGRNA